MQNQAMHPSMKRLYQAALEHHSIKGPSALARALNVSAQTVTNWETRGMSRQGLLTAQAKLKVSAEWLEFGVGTDRLAGFSAAAEVQQGGHRVPVIGRDWFTPHRQQPDEWLMTDVDVSDLAFAFQLVDQSMSPVFSPSDRVIVDPDLMPEPGDHVVATTAGGDIVVRKYRERTSQAGKLVVELTPTNDDFPTLSSEFEQFTVRGVVVEHRRRFHRSPKQ